MLVNGARDIATSDTPVGDFNWVLVTGASGDVVIGGRGDDRTLTAVPVGVWIPVGNATHIKTASTASGFIVA